MDHFSYTWVMRFRINDDRFHSMPKTKEILMYPDYISSKFKLTWTFGCRFHFVTDQMCTYLVIEKSEVMEEVWANFKFSILDQKGKIFKSLETKQACKFIKEKRWGFEKFIDKNVILDKSNGLLTNRQFTIVCEVTASSSLEFNFASILSKEYEVKMPECNLSNDLWSMYKNKKFSDVTITVGNKEFKAHKNILAARSPVFSAMFEHKMKESKHSQVNITDIDPVVFEEIMHYVYTGESTKLDTMAEDLLAAANKYQIERLKIMCGKVLCKKLTVDNAVKVLFLADLYSVNELKMQAIDFICEYAKKVEKTEDFKSIMTLHPHLLIATFQELADKTISTGIKQDPIVIENYF